MGLFRKKIKNKALDPSTYSSSNFWGDISNAFSTNREMKIAAVFRCVDVLSDNVSMLPWASVDSNSHKKPDDPYAKQIWYLLNMRPNRNMTPAIFFKTLEQHRLNGNAYAEIKTAGNGIPIELKIINPNSVQIEELDNGDIIYKITDKKGIQRKVLSYDILHFKNISKDGLIGESVLSYASNSISNMTYQEEFSKNFYQKGGRPSGILSIESDISGKTIQTNDPKNPINGKSLKDAMREDFEKHVGGSSNAGRVAIVDNGAKYQTVQPISQKDMAFVESKEVSIADIARFYGVPLYKLFTGKESYESNEQNNIAFVTDKLNPIVTGYEQELTYKLYTNERVRAGVQIKANLNVLLRGDGSARAIFYEKLRNIGVMSANDIRSKEDMSNIEGGEVYLASLNYVPLSNFEELSKARNIPKENTSKEEKQDETI